MNAHPNTDELARLAMQPEGNEPHHVAMCPECRAEIESYRVIVHDLRMLGDPPEDLQEAASAYFARRRALEDLIARLAEDPALRARAETDPAAVLRKAGIDPTADLVEALRDVGRGQSSAGDRLAARLLWF
jgi:hypothetical protein